MSIITTLAISFFAAWITMQFALRRFYREKWWDKRATAYLELIEALYELKEDYGIMADHEFAKSNCGGSEGAIITEEIISPDTESLLWERVLATHKKLAKLQGLGPLIYTEDALVKITDFIKRDSEISRNVMNEEMDTFDAYDELRSSAEILYGEFKTTALLELKITSKLENFLSEKCNKLRDYVYGKLKRN